jgi:hypothetical protein
MQPAVASTRLRPLSLGIIVLTAVTAVIHLVLAVGADPMTMVMFTLNGLGYLALVAALYLPQFRAYHRLIRWALIAFAAVTIIGWVAVGERSTIGYLDKLVELALIALLLLEGRHEAA